MYVPYSMSMSYIPTIYLISYDMFCMHKSSS